MNGAPVFAGFLALIALSATLVVREPSPGALGRAHAELEGDIETCAVCHAEGGLDAGCRSCHHEIDRQVETKTGIHADRASDCASCHPDHHGEEFDVMEAIAWRPGSRAAFKHEHVEFKLAGSHDGLACRRCHRAERTYLGLVQDCAACHEDVHGSGLFRECAQCHDQRKFVPASNFDHARSFPLLGRHAKAACDRCHSSLDYKAVKGKECRSCHESPHRFGSPSGCEACHGGADDSWQVAQPKFDAARHAETGFALTAAHAAVACAKCHEPALPYPERFREPAREAEACTACHEDVHRGQFRAACTTCHEQTRFRPARYDRERHTTFALKGAHATIECRACHTEVEGVRRFVGTPRECAQCHRDPHAGQFKESCDRCHGERAFLPVRYPLERHTAFPLDGAHGAVACNSCHEVESGTRRFLGTPKECGACHADPHGGQFAREKRGGGCRACHGQESFRIRPFDHAKKTDYRLEDAHARARCTQCHTTSGEPPVRRYRETPRSCASCHADEHRGQFAGRDCTTCHAGFHAWEIRRFDHAKTKFPLDGKHERVSCGDCHPRVRQRDGREVVQYRPLGHQCKDCHEVERR